MMVMRLPFCNVVTGDDRGDVQGAEVPLYCSSKRNNVCDASSMKALYTVCWSAFAADSAANLSPRRGPELHGVMAHATRTGNGFGNLVCSDARNPSNNAVMPLIEGDPCNVASASAAPLITGACGGMGGRGVMSYLKPKAPVWSNPAVATAASAT